MVPRLQSLVALTGGLTAIEKIDEPTLLVFPEATKLADETAYGQVVQASLALCDKLQDRFTIADFYGDISDNTAVSDYRTALGMNYLKYGASYGPDLKSTLNHGFTETSITITHLQSDNSALPGGADDFAGDLTGVEAANPSVYRAVLAEINKLYLDLPSSPAVAGAYARVDSDRGVWKAPANVSLTSVLGTCY